MIFYDHVSVLQLTAGRIFYAPKNFFKNLLTFVSPYVIIFMVTQKRGDLMSPRTGRPTTDPKNHETRIRMTDEDVRILEFCASKTGMTKTEVIRQGIREVYAKLQQEEKK